MFHGAAACVDQHLSILVIESAGAVPRFTIGFDTDPVIRSVFTLYRPETLAEIGREHVTLRARLRDLPN